MAGDTGSEKSNAQILAVGIQIVTVVITTDSEINPIADHSLELPSSHVGLEVGTCPGCRMHHCSEARYSFAKFIISLTL